MERTRRLPPRSLLITFDDGFADNIEYALPLLRMHCVSATVFITSDVIGREERLWTEDLLWASAAGLIRQREIACLHRQLITGSKYAPESPKLIWDIVRRRPDLDEAHVQAAPSKLKIDLHRIKHHPRQIPGAGCGLQAPVYQRSRALRLERRLSGGPAGGAH
jgi:Polysaccharide deacetylase